MTEPDAAYSKVAACACGALTLTVSAPPQFTHACACVDCQRGTGSAFSYSGFFAEAVVTVKGPTTKWRRGSDSGRWQDTYFCPTCGVTVFSRLEALPGIVCASAGCFGAQDFPPPGNLYWNSRRHHWLELPASIGRVETQ